MRRRCFRPALLALMLLHVLPAHAAAASRAFDPTGVWTGVLAGPGNVLPVVIRISADARSGAWHGLLDIPTRGLYDAAGVLGVSGDSVRFEVRALGASFRGVRVAEDSVFGVWLQAGAGVELQLVRESADPVRRRPQDPRGPRSYREVEVTFPSAAGVLLQGTLTLPAGEGPHAAVVLIGGSGPQDRDARHAGHRPFLVIADHLAGRGVAVLRYDERGIGGSGGTHEDAATPDFADDALGAVRFLAQHSAVDAARIGLIGHSEGGMVASMVAAGSDDVAFLALLAAPGLPLADIALRQAAAIAAAEGVDEATRARHHEALRTIIAVMRSSLDRPQRAARIRAALEFAYAGAAVGSAALVDVLIDRTVDVYLSPWAEFAFRYDPAAALRSVRVPVLALNGTLDTQVDASANLPAIAAALRDGGNLDVTARAMPGLNHYFQSARTGAPSEYAHLEETIAHSVLDQLHSWISAVAAVASL